MKENLTGLEIAVVGMSCRFSKANSIEEFWENIKNGEECLSFLSEEELKDINTQITSHPRYVNAKGGVIEDHHYFDESFFGYTPNEAKVMDPQTRLLHELVWEALEDSGYNSFEYSGSIGLFASATHNLYWELMSANSKASNQIGKFASTGLASRDSIGTLIAYKLNLKGPVVYLSSACSSSLVSIHSASRALLGGECNMAMAAGIAIPERPNNGYVHEPGMVLSSDGRCKAFDEQSDGTVPGQGGGVVVLKLLEDAIRDNDNIYAVIKGSSVNNDGSQKIGYSAPSFLGQQRVIKNAIAMAEIPPETIGYIETHGTGTTLGDPIEIDALKSAFSLGAEKSCAIGSVKTNIGHTDVAAGIAGFIKTVLSLKSQLLTPSLHFNKPNPKLKLEESPFYVNTKLQNWKSNNFPRRAGISSFGIGGTNAHIILEEYEHKSFEKRLNNCVVSISARSEKALQDQVKNIAKYLGKTSFSHEDVCYTLHNGRKHFNHRMSVIVEHDEQITNKLLDQTKFIRGVVDDLHKEPVFLFSGQGTQYLKHGKELYESLPVFKKEVDHCAELIHDSLGQDIRNFIVGGENEEKLSKEIFKQSISQPLLFIIEYALTKVLNSWGIQPSYMIGHSIGEYVAAHIAGVFDLHDVLNLIVQRGKLMETLPEGAMLYVPLEERELNDILPESLSIAIINEPGCVVAGKHEHINAFENELRKRRIITMRLEVSHAGHSSLLDPMISEFEQEIRKIKLRPPRIPFISNLTGEFILDKEATDYRYWSRHIKSTVRLSQGIKNLCKIENAVYLEIGPGNTLTSTLKRLYGQNQEAKVLSFALPEGSDYSEEKFMYHKLAQLWCWGVAVDWKSFYRETETFKRISLPTYPFERKLFEVEKLDFTKITKDPAKRNDDFLQWFYTPEWKRKNLSEFTVDHQYRGCLFINTGGEKGELLGEELSNRVDLVSLDEKEIMADNLNARVHFLVENFKDKNQKIQKVVFFIDPKKEEFNLNLVLEVQENIFFKLLNVIKVCGTLDTQFKIIVVSNGLHDVVGIEDPNPAYATLLGLLKVANQEYANLKCFNIDFQNIDVNLDQSASQLMIEIESESYERIVAFRGNHRWVQIFENNLESKILLEPSRLKHGGVYLILGGLGNVGFVMAEYLAIKYKAKLILTGRTTLPERKEWDEYLRSSKTSPSLKLRLKKMMKFEELGVEVTYFAADIGNYEQMKINIDDSISKLGKPNGVIYSVTEIDDSQKSLINDITSEQIDVQFNTKIKGLINIDELTKELKLDFFLLLSSNSSILGGLGYSAYSSANIFMDFYANYQHKKNRKYFISYNSVGWQYYNDQLDLPVFETGDYNQRMTLKEGYDTLETILKFNTGSQVVGCLNDLQFQISNWVNINNDDSTQVDTNLQINRVDSFSEYVEPTSTSEQVLAELWSVVFGYDQIGIKDDFFELGGDSLKAIKLISKIETKLGKNILLKEFLTLRTIENIAHIIDSKDGMNYKSIPRAEKKEVYPLSSAQKRLFFLQKANPESTAYNEQIILRVTGCLNVEVVQKVFVKLIERHEVLRTSFIEDDGIPYQKINSKIGFDISHIINSSEPDKVIHEFVKPFSLDKPPFFRVLLMGTGEHEHILMIDQHHLITDGVSFNILKKEFQSLLINEELPTLHLQYKDFSEWQSRQLIKGILKEQESYWDKKFSDGIKSTKLGDLQSENIKGSCIVNYKISEEDTFKFKEMLNDGKVTVFNGLLSILNILLYKVTRESQINVVSPVLGRRREELQEILGIFINMLVLSNQVNDEITFTEFLQQVNESSLDAFQNDEYPFEELVKKLKKSSNDYTSPEFNVLFTIRDINEKSADDVKPISNDLLTFEFYGLEIYEPKYNLEVVFEEKKSGIEMMFISNNQFLSVDTAHKLKDYFALIFKEVIKSNQVVLKDIILERDSIENDHVEVESMFESFDF